MAASEESIGSPGNTDQEATRPRKPNYTMFSESATEGTRSAGMHSHTRLSGLGKAT